MTRNSKCSSSQQCQIIQLVSNLLPSERRLLALPLEPPCLSLEGRQTCLVHAKPFMIRETWLKWQNRTGYHLDATEEDPSNLFLGLLAIPVSLWYREDSLPTCISKQWEHWGGLLKGKRKRTWLEAKVYEPQSSQLINILIYYFYAISRLLENPYQTDLRLWCVLCPKLHC